MTWMSKKRKDSLPLASQADAQSAFMPRDNALSDRFQPPDKEQRISEKEQGLRGRQLWEIIRKLAGEDPLQQAFAENELRQIILGDGDWAFLSNAARRLAHVDAVKELLSNVAVPFIGISWLFVTAAAIIRFLFEKFPPFVAWGIIFLMGYGVYLLYRKYRSTLDWQAIGLGRALKILDDPDGALLLLLVRSARELPGETSAIAANLLDRAHYPLDVWMQYPEALLGLRAAVSRRQGLMEPPEAASQRQALQLAAIRKVGVIRDVDSIPLLKALTKNRSMNHRDLAIYEEARRSLEILEHFKANPQS